MLNVCEILGTKYPIIQGAMARIAEYHLAAAVSNGGGLGIIAAGGQSGDWLKDQIKKTREMTDKPFGVNIMLMADNVDELVEVVCEEKVPVVTTGAGNPGKYIAKMKEHGQLGKTEMWYVLDAARDAKLIYGLRQDCTKKEMQKALAEGTVMKYLQKVPIHKDDLFFIPAGTIHAIGAGALVAEIQESSNLTYRLYDYDRIGKDGKKRELHIDKALDVADLHGSAEPRQPLRVLKYRPGMASELLIRCKYFEVYRMLINTERRQTVHYRADRMAFRVLLCMDGCGTISYDEGTVNFYKGDCVFVPADSEVLTIHGQAQFLDIRG